MYLPYDNIVQFDDFFFVVVLFFVVFFFVFFFLFVFFMFLVYSYGSETIIN